MADQIKEPPFFSHADFQSATLAEPCTLCPEFTTIRVVRHRGARGFPGMPYCLIHAVGLKYHFLNAGTLVKVEGKTLDKPVLIGGKK